MIELEAEVDARLFPPSTGGDLLVRGARTWPGGELIDVLVLGGRIAAIGQDLGAGRAEVVAADGLALIPGLIDVHVHFRDPGLAHKEGWESGSAGALHGGVTAVVEVQNNPPLSVTRERLVERIAHVRARSRVDFACLANLLPESLPALEAMAPLTPALKLFLGGSTGVGGVIDRPTLRTLFTAAARTGRMIVAHCEDEARLQEDKRRHPRASAAEHHLVRSEAAEVESIRTSIELVEETGARLHIFHVSTAQGVALVREARRRGLPIGSSTAPHYVLLSSEDAAGLGNRLKVNPSIKTPADAKGILAGLADGSVEALGTDHAPHPLEEKLREYRHAPSGMPSVDLLWPLTFELVRRGWLDPATALASVTSSAARSLEIPRKGRLAPGYDGDLVLFDPDEERVVDERALPSKSKWSAFHGWRLAGFPRIVVRRGVVAFRDGAVLGDAGGAPLALVKPRPTIPIERG